jgi:hypothetical protein
MATKTIYLVINILSIYTHLITLSENPFPKRFGEVHSTSSEYSSASASNGYGVNLQQLVINQQSKGTYINEL